METATLGTLLRDLTEILDGAVADAYRTAAPGYRPRFTPVIRELLRDGPLSITQVKCSVGASHSAISQTVAEMVREDLVVLKAGPDQRERIIDLTPKARRLLPILKAQWAYTERAARSIDADLGMPLDQVLRSVIAALDDKPFAVRIVEAQQSFGEKP
jgi:DNA-binding MarR family transcriptional regulator